MLIEVSSLDRERPSYNDKVYINTNNIVYMRPNMSDHSKTEIFLVTGTICLVNNPVENVIRLLKEFEKND